MTQKGPGSLQWGVGQLDTLPGLQEVAQIAWGQEGRAEAGDLPVSNLDSPWTDSPRAQSEVRLGQKEELGEAPTYQFI